MIGLRAVTEIWMTGGLGYVVLSPGRQGPARAAIFQSFCSFRFQRERIPETGIDSIAVTGRALSRTRPE